MKRKLALLLAGTMVLSTVSTSTIFAAVNDVTSGNAMAVSKTTATSGSAILGELGQVLPANSAFTFELVNGTFVAGTGVSTGATTITTTENQLNVAYTSAVTRPEVKFDFKSTDASKPTYLKITFSNVAGFAGKEIQLSQVVSKSVTASITTKAVQDTTGSEATGGVITVKSDLAGAFTAAQNYTLTLPAGYTWKSVPTVTVNGTVQTLTENTNYTLSGDKRTITVVVPAITETTVFGSQIVFSGLDIKNDNAVYNQDVNVSVKKDGTELVNGSIVKFLTYGVKAVVDSNDDIAANFTFNSGLTAGNTSATIKISENVAGSYRGGDLYITVPSGVKILSVANLSTTNMANTVTTSQDGNKATISGVKGAAGLASSLALDLVLQVSPSFEGDVTATLTAANTLDLPNAIEIGKIATFKSPFAVTTEVSEALIGVADQDASEIVLTEKVPGTFKYGTTVEYTLGAYGQGYALDKDASVEITNGTAKIEYTAATSDAAIGANHAGKYKVTVTGVEDSTKPVVITLKDVEVSAARQLTTYVNEVTDINVTVSGYTTESTDYVKFVSEFSSIVDEIVETPAEIYNSDVKITLGSNTATLADGTKVELYGTPYVSADGNTMVPVKGFGFALGLDASEIVYDPAEKMATFFLEDGKSIAQIQNGSNYVVIDGVRKPLIDANGKLVAPVVKDGRFYLPLRACGTTMFGVDVQYNAADKSVVINPSK